MKHYRSEAERNLWHGAAESWRSAGQHFMDPPGFITRRPWYQRLPWPVQICAGCSSADSRWPSGTPSRTEFSHE